MKNNADITIMAVNNLERKFQSQIVLLKYVCVKCMYVYMYVFEK